MMLDPANNPRDAAAVHEGGHCLALWSNAHQVDRVCGKIEPQTFPRSDSLDPRACLEVARAGEEAERFLGVDNPSGCGRDRASADTALRQLREHDADERARQRVREIVELQERALRGVACRIRRISGAPGNKCVEEDELEVIAREAWLGDFPVDDG